MKEYGGGGCHENRDLWATGEHRLCGSVWFLLGDPHTSGFLCFSQQPEEKEIALSIFLARKLRLRERVQDLPKAVGEVCVYQSPGLCASQHFRMQLQTLRAVSYSFCLV